MNLLHEHLALDIGTHSLKLLAVAPQPGRSQPWRLAEALIQPLPAGLIAGGCTNPTIADCGELKRQLQKLFSRNRSGLDSVIVGLPDRWVKLHLLDLPLKRTELDSPGYLSWRLKRTLCPPELGEVALDHQVLRIEETAEGLQCHVLAGIVRQDLLDRLAHLFVELRLQLMAFDTSTLGVYSIYEALNESRCREGQLIHAHLGHETSVVKIFERGVLRYERVIEVGGEAFTALLAEAQGIDLERAAQEKARRVFFPAARHEILAMIPQRPTFEKVFGNWLRELHVTFKFYQDKFKVQRLPPLILTWGSALFPGLAAFLADYFDTSCEVFNGLTLLDRPRGTGLEAPPEAGPAFTACLGLLAS